MFISSVVSEKEVSMLHSKDTFLSCLRLSPVINVPFVL